MTEARLTATNCEFHDVAFSRKPTIGESGKFSEWRLTSLDGQVVHLRLDNNGNLFLNSLTIQPIERYKRVLDQSIRLGIKAGILIGLALALATVTVSHLLA